MIKVQNVGDTGGCFRQGVRTDWKGWEGSLKTTLVRVFSRDPIRGKLTNRGKPRYLRAGGASFIQFRFRFLGIKGVPRPRAYEKKKKEGKKLNHAMRFYGRPFRFFFFPFSLDDGSKFIFSTVRRIDLNGKDLFKKYADP